MFVLETLFGSVPLRHSHFIVKDRAGWNAPPEAECESRLISIDQTYESC